MSDNRRKPEEMASFFDARADGYDAHMRRTVQSFEAFYRAVAEPIVETACPVEILDIGCGTGLELDAIFQKAPRAEVTCMDLSANMLAELARKHAAFAGQIKLVQGSYLFEPFGEGRFDYAVSTMTVHHLLHEAKRDLYRRIRESLKAEGIYIEGDYVVSPEEERQYLGEYPVQVRLAGATSDGSHHIDIPFSVDTQTRLLTEAGFSRVEVVWHEGAAAVMVAVA